MTDLLTITEEAVSALGRHKHIVTQSDSHSNIGPSTQAQSTPVLSLYNAFMDYDSDVSGSGIGSVNSHSTSAGSVLINSTSNVDIYKVPSGMLNREFLAHASEDMQCTATKIKETPVDAKPVRVPVKNLKEIDVQQMVRIAGRNRVSPSDGTGGTSDIFPVRVSTAVNTHRISESSSSVSSESAREEYQKWLCLGNRSRQQKPCLGTSSKLNEGGQFCASYDGKGTQWAFSLKDSGYSTQPMCILRTAETADRVDSMKAIESISSASFDSPIVIQGREEDLSSRESELSVEPDIITVPQTIVNVRSTASAGSVSSAGSIAGASDSEQNQPTPFVALKERFLKFHPVILKQGTLTSEAIPSFKETSDEVLVEQFVLDDKQRRLHEDFHNRQNGSAAIKKRVPAKIIQSSFVKPADVKTAPEVTTSGASMIPEYVTSATVAAVVATQAVMKSQQQEILDKISELESKKSSSEAEKLSHGELLARDENDRKLELLEAQLAHLTQKRLEDLERQQETVQAQLFLISRQQSSANDGHLNSHFYDKRRILANEKPSSYQPWVKFSREHSSSSASLIQDMEREKMSVLDTPAPRQKRPIPTTYDERSNYSSREKKQLSGSEVYDVGISNSFPVNLRNNHDRDVEKLRTSQNSSPKSPTRLNKVGHLLDPSQHALSPDLNLAKDIPKSPDSLPVQPAPLEKYLRKPAMHLVNTSPYPEFKGIGAPRLSALVHYAEAEAVLKHVQANHALLESNLETIERFRNNKDLCSNVSHLQRNRSLADKMRIKRLIGERINSINRQIEVEVDELMKQEQPKEANKFLLPEKDSSGARGSKKPGGKSYPGRRKGGVSDVEKFIVPDKENIPKKIKPKAYKKPRPLNPVDDENQLQKIYGKALYHKMRNSHKPLTECKHSSPKSKLPRSPVKIAGIKVKGVEMASAKTQTAFSGQTNTPGQFVQGLQGQLIPMAIPFSQREEQLPKFSRLPQKNPPKKKTHVTLEMSKQLPSESPVIDDIAMPTREESGEEEEEEEEETTLSEEGQVISLPGYTSPPVAYHGPQFPLRIPTMQPSPSSEVLAADIRQSDLQKQAIDWIEQELMARIISEMYSKQSDQKEVKKIHAERPTTAAEDDVSIFSSDEDQSVHNSVIVDTIGQEGVQLFVDAGHPVNENLVNALIKEVLLEKIGSMCGLGKGTFKKKSDSLEPPRLTFKIEASATPVADAVVYHAPESGIRSLIPTPEPTPEPSSSHSQVSHFSLPSTPRKTPPLDSLAETVAVQKGQTVISDEQRSDEEEDVSFPTYEGMSNSESQHMDGIAVPSEDLHDVDTPSVTPVPSPPFLIRTPSPSASESVHQPVKETKETQVDFELPAEVTSPVIQVQEPCREKVESRQQSLEFENLAPVVLPTSEVSSPVTMANVASRNDDESSSEPTEPSTTNNEFVSEGQWIITLLSEGEIPSNFHLDEALKQRVRQHMINASRLHYSLDEDTYDNTEDIEQDPGSEMIPSEGEIMVPQYRLGDQELIVKAVSRPKSTTGLGLHMAGALSGVKRSVGEVRFDDDFEEPVNHNFHQLSSLSKPRKNADDERRTSKNSSFDENRISLGEVFFDQRNGSANNNFGQINKEMAEMDLVAYPNNKGIVSQADEGQGDRSSIKPIFVREAKETEERSEFSQSEAKQPSPKEIRLQLEHPVGGSDGATKTGVRERMPFGTGKVMSTQEFGNRTQGLGQLKSPQQTLLSHDTMKRSYETDLSQTASLMESDSRELRKSDLIQSHDHLTQSELGSTGQSLPGKGQLPFQATYSLHKSLDLEQSASMKSSFRYEMTETSDMEQFSRNLEDSLEGTEMSKNEELMKSEESRYQMPVKIPSVSAYDEGSESEISEISLGQHDL